jgi:excisionase family DNA binding protein
MKRLLKSSGMLTTSPVAQLLNIHPNTVRQRANRGLLPVYRLGMRGDRRFKWDDVDNFIRLNGHSNTKIQG